MLWAGFLCSSSWRLLVLSSIPKMKNRLQCHLFNSSLNFVYMYKANILLPALPFLRPFGYLMQMSTTKHALST